MSGGDFGNVRQSLTSVESNVALRVEIQSMTASEYELEESQHVIVGSINYGIVVTQGFVDELT